MATMINGQLILEEEYDENYQPTEQGKIFEKKNVQRRIKLHNEQKRCINTSFSRVYHFLCSMDC